MSLFQLYDTLSANARRWIFLLSTTTAIVLFSAMSFSVKSALNKHVALVDKNTQDITVLEQRTDSIIGESNNNWRKIERYLCFNNRAAAILAGYDCPSK